MPELNSLILQSNDYYEILQESQPYKTEKDTPFLFLIFLSKVESKWKKLSVKQALAWLISFMLTQSNFFTVKQRSDL